MVAKMRSSNDFLFIFGLFCKLFWSRKLKKTFLSMHRVIIRSTHYNCSHFSATTKFRCIDIVVVILIRLKRFKFWRRKMRSLGINYIMYCRFGSFSETLVRVYIVVMRMLIPWFPGIPWNWKRRIPGNQGMSSLFLSGFGRAQDQDHSMMEWTVPRPTH